MAEFLLMPQATPTMTVGVLAKWTIPEGGALVPQSVIASVETDKATMDIEYFDRGVLIRQLAKEGDEIPPGRPIAIIGASASEDISALLAEYAKLVSGVAAPAAAAPAAVAPAAVAPAAAAPVAPAPVAPAAAPARTTPGSTPVITWAGRPINESIMEPRGTYVAAAPHVRASPLARAVAAELGVKLDRVTGTGPDGRIVKADVEGAAAGSASQSQSSAPPRADVSKRVSQMRKTISRRLTDVHQQVPVFYLNVVFDMTGMVALKATAASAGMKISYNDLFLKAVARSLRDVPAVNAAWMGDTIVERGSVDIGVAVALPDGLITPVVRNADQKSVTAIAAEVRELATRAKDGKLQPDEYMGSTMTISNLGMFNIDNFTAIINAPESAILAVGSVDQVPVVINGQLAVGWRMKVTMTCDHRVIDGALGAKFLLALRTYVESPAMLVL